MGQKTTSSGAENVVFGAAIQGQRSEQQDSFCSIWLPKERAWLLIIADGMGGHAAGEVASRIAVDTFITSFNAARSAGTGLEEALNLSLDSANARIASTQRASPETIGMGTTLVAAHLSTNGLAWISVGDSPLWLYRADKLIRLNEDHSLRGAVAAGARGVGNLLQSALNGQTIALIDCRAQPYPLLAGDLVLISSDGLLTLTEDEIAATVRQSSVGGPEAITRAILDAVEDRRKSNQDNCAVVVASVI